MKARYGIAACAVGLIAFATLGHTAITGADLTVIDKTSLRTTIVPAQSVESITLTRTRSRVKSVDIRFTIADRPGRRLLSLVSRSQSLLRSKYETIQATIERKRRVAITASAVRVLGQYVSNVDIAPLVVVVGQPIPAPTPTPTPTPSPTATPTPATVVLDQLAGDFSADAVKIYDTSTPDLPPLESAISSVALVQQAEALAIEVGLTLSDGAASHLSITGAAADAVRAHYKAIGAALATGQSFWLSISALPDGSESNAYRASIESAVLSMDVLPNRTGSGTIPGVALTVSPGADPLVIASGVQSIGTQSVNGAVALRLSFFIPGDPNQRWLTLKGSEDAVFTQFASLIRSINSRWRFGLYAYSAASADAVFYEATLGVDALILSLQPASGAALPRMTASAVVGDAVPISNMPVRALYLYYDVYSGPYVWAQGTDADGNQAGLMITHATTALYDDVVSGLSASDAMTTTLTGYGAPHSTYANTYVADLDVDALYLTAGLGPPAPARMSITAAYAGGAPVTSSQVNSTNVAFSGGKAVSESYFISSADGTQRPLTLIGGANASVQATFDRITRSIAAGKNVAIQALDASPGGNDDFVIDVASATFVLTVN